jgi:hypothetical protein
MLLLCLFDLCGRVANCLQPQMSVELGDCGALNRRGGAPEPQSPRAPVYLGARFKSAAIRTVRARTSAGVITQCADAVPRVARTTIPLHRLQVNRSKSPRCFNKKDTQAPRGLCHDIQALLALSLAAIWQRKPVGEFASFSMLFCPRLVVHSFHCRSQRHISSTAASCVLHDSFG